MFRHIPFIDKKTANLGRWPPGAATPVSGWHFGGSWANWIVKATEKDIYGNSKTSLDLKFMIQR